MKTRWISLWLAVVLMAGCGVSTRAEIGVEREAAPSGETLRIDFSEHTGIPLFKRQNTFSPSHSFLGNLAEEFMRDAPLLKALRSESQRVDLFMGNGGIGHTIGMGTPDALSHSFLTTDTLFRQFYQNGTMPYIVYFATPTALQNKNAASYGFWKYPPVDYDAWAQVCQDIAAHYREMDWPLAAHEVWNEPDWFDAAANAMAFYGGTWEEYLKIYDYAARGIRQGDPYAMVGGLSLAEFEPALQKGQVDQFLTYVREKALPLDFISYHCYVPNHYPRYTLEANQALAAYGDQFAQTGLHMNEFNISLASSTTSTEKAVAPMLDAILYFVETPQVTSVNWACFRVSHAASEAGIGLIDSRSGKRYAAYHLLSFYNRMPVDRVRLEEAGSVRGIASADEYSAAAFLYNRTWKKRQVTVKLDNIPFEHYRLTVYGLDEENSNYGRAGGSDEASVVYAAENLTGKEQLLSLTLSSGAAVYAELCPTDGAERAPVAEWQGEAVIHGGVATVIRREYYFENRATTMFSEFDLASFTAWAGMGSADEGLSRGSVYLRNVPDGLCAYPTLQKDGETKGECFLMAQYLNGQGEITAEETYSTLDGTLPLNGKIPLKPLEDSDGVLKLTYGLRSAGQDQTLKIRFQAE